METLALRYDQSEQPSRQKRLSLWLLTPRRVRRLRNATVVVTLLSALGALTLDGRASDEPWPDLGNQGYLTPGEQLMRERLRPGEPDAESSGGRSLREISEERLRALFRGRGEELWDEIDTFEGKGEDYGMGDGQGLMGHEPTNGNGPAPVDPARFAAIKNDAAAVPVGQGEGFGFQVAVDTPRDGPDPSPQTGQGANGDAGNGGNLPIAPPPRFGAGGGGTGVPIGAIGDSLARVALPIEEDDEGNGELTDDPVTLPETEPGIGDENGNPGAVAAVPVPGALLLFPAGLLALRRVRKS